MSFTALTTFSFGASQTSLSDLVVQPLTAAFASTGGTISTGFVEQGGGIYGWSGSVPDNTSQLKAYRTGNTAIVSTRPAELAPANGLIATNTTQISGTTQTAADVGAAVSVAVTQSTNANAAATAANAATSTLLNRSAIRSPTDIANNVLTLLPGVGMYDATTGGNLVTDGVAIGRWEDQSTSANHATQSTAANRPLYDLAINAANYVAGKDNALVLPNISVNRQAFSAFLLIELDSLLQYYSASYGNTYSTVLLIPSGDASATFCIDTATRSLSIYHDNAHHQATALTLPAGGRCFIGLVASSTGVDVYVNDRVQTIGVLSTGTTTLTSIGFPGAAAGGGLVLGTCDGSIVGSFIYSRTVTKSEVSSLLTYCSTRLGLNPVKTHGLLPVGDSIGYGYLDGRGMFRRLTLSGEWEIYNLSQAAMTLTTHAANAATVIDPYLKAQKTSELIGEAGTNDIGLLGQTAAQVYALVKTFIASRRVAGWQRVGWVVPFPRNDSTANANAVALLRTLLINGQASGDLGADYLVDASPSLDPNDATLYGADKLHLLDKGAAIVAAAIGAKLLPTNAQVATAVPAAILSTPSNKLATGSDGSVTASNAGEGGNTFTFDDEQTVTLD